MQNVIPLYRPPTWRRLAIGATILVVAGLCASAAFAGAAHADGPVHQTARQLC